MTILSPTFGPCEPWVTPDDIPDDCVPEGATAAEIAMACRFASRTLWLLSGKKWTGPCPQEEHPCAGLTCGLSLDGRWVLWGLGYVPSVPVHIEGGWVNIPLGGGRCQVDCLELPGPITSIEVWVDGVQLVEGVDYRVSGWRAVCRIPQGTFWPVDADPTLPKEEPGSFAMVFTRGKPVPQIARDMAQLYAIRRILPMVCTAGCMNQMQEGLESASADGINLAWQNMGGDNPLAEQRTGIGIIDEWLRAENPRNRRGRTMRVYSVGSASRRNRRWVDGA